jgi:hypothetical protein
VGGRGGGIHGEDGQQFLQVLTSAGGAGWRVAVARQVLEMPAAAAAFVFE